MRHQHLLIRRLRELLSSRISKRGHLMQVVVQERLGNCDARRGCTSACREATELMALTEPYMEKRPLPPVKRLRLVVLRRPTKSARAVRRARSQARQPSLFDEAV